MGCTFMAVLTVAVWGKPAMKEASAGSEENLYVKHEQVCRTDPARPRGRIVFTSRDCHVKPRATEHMQAVE